jgi:hypothetical protein
MRKRRRPISRTFWQNSVPETEPMQYHWASSEGSSCYSRPRGDARLTLLRVIAKLDSRLILRRAKALFDVPQFVAGNWAVDSSIGRRPLVSRRSACGGRSRRRDKPICTLCGGRRRSIDLDWVMDTDCGGHRSGDSDHRHHFCTPIQFVVGGLRCRGLVAGHAGAGSLVLRCSLVWPQAHHINA